MWKEQYACLDGHCCEYANEDIKLLFLKDNTIAEILSPFVFKFCACIEMSKKTSQIVVTPFVALKSVRYSELLGLYSQIYHGKIYSGEQKNPEKFYREIEFNLNQYLYQIFEHDLNGMFEHVKVVTKCCHLQNDYAPVFLEDTENMIRNHFASYVHTMINYRRFTSIQAENLFQQFTWKFRDLTCDQKTVFLYLYALLFMAKIESQKDISYEELQLILKKAYANESQEKLDQFLLMAICIMKRHHIIIENLVFSKEKNIIFHTFELKEVQPLLFDLSAKIFFTGVSTFYETAIKKDKRLYSDNYERFLCVFSVFLDKYHLFDVAISRDDFRIYSEIYRHYIPDKTPKIISGKNANMSEVPVYLQKLRHYISNSNVYD